MRREINPQLFQQPGLTAVSNNNLDSQSVQSDLKDLMAQVFQLKTQNQILERKVEQQTLQTQEQLKVFQSRFERVGQQIMRLEGSQSQVAQELTEKYASIAGKMNERRVSDAKVQDLIDRHNMLVMNFENRVTHLTRIINEQELKLHNATAALEDARQEIARLRSTRPV